MNFMKIKYFIFVIIAVIFAKLGINTLLPIRNVDAAPAPKKLFVITGENINPTTNPFTTDNTISNSSSLLSPTILDIVVGNNSTCALFTDGNFKCWGAVSLIPSDHNPLVFNFPEPTISISTNSYDSCLVTQAGGAKCWGSNGGYQLGDGTNTPRTDPINVIGLSSGVITTSANRPEYSCALTDQGGVYCWGYDGLGLIGASHTTPQIVPSLESGVKKMASGDFHTCALTSTNGLKCWGQGRFGQLGDNSTVNRFPPVDVTGLSSGVKNFFMGYRYTCALLSSDAVKCWGQNSYGKLGDGSTINRLTPVDVTSSFGDVKDIALGGDHTCVLSNLGGVRCWGRNDYGQLGDGTTINSTTPVNVVGLSSGVKSIFASYNDTCALLDSGLVKCWGSFPYYQAMQSSVPIEIGWDSWYTLTGIIKDDKDIPQAGVLVTLNTGQTTTTNSAGFYKFYLQEPATFTITPSLSGYRFAPEQALLNLAVTNSRDFIIRPDTPTPFLDLPLAYPSKPGWTSEQLFANAALGSNNGLAPGYVNSWFDHKSPKYQVFDGYITPWHGIKIPDPTGVQCKYGSSCYDSHNGIDFRHTTTGDESIFAAGDGEVVTPTKILGYGNSVLIDHRNGYATFYGHLTSSNVAAGDTVTAGQPIGIMGNTGQFKMGVHLHFGVYYDLNGDKNWDENEVVDPFGWRPKNDPDNIDPWKVESYYLWKYPNELVCSVTSAGVTQKSPTGLLTMEVPPGAVTSESLLEVLDVPPAVATSASFRFTGRSFFTSIQNPVSGLSSSSIGDITQSESSGFTSPVNMVVNYEPSELSHIDISNLAIYHLDEVSGSWVELPSTINTIEHTVTAQTTDAGNFSVQGPLLCPAATQEPNDNYDSAVPLSDDGAITSDSFDIPDDEDWYRFDGISSGYYLIETTNLSLATATVIEIFDTDGITLLASNDNFGTNFSSRVQWEAPRDGIFYVRVIPSPSSAIGCDTSYDLGINKLVPLSPPALMVPENDDITNDDTPTFSWELVTDGDHYQFQISQTSEFSSIVQDSTRISGILTYTSSPLTDGKYYWRVRAYTVDDIYGYWSTPYSFTIDTLPPSPPTLTSPISSATVRGIPAYTWNSDPDAIGFAFQYDTNSDFSSPEFTSDEISNTNFTPPTQTPGVYYWHVKARDAAGNWSNWSEYSQVTIKPLIPVAPVLVSPATGKITNDNTPTFTWKSVPDGYKYRIQLSKTSTFTLPVFKNIVLSPGVLTFTAPKLADGKYFWRVMAINLLDEGKNWSVVRNFTVDTVKPAAPVLSSPADNATVTGIPTYKWQTVSGAKFYQLSYATNSTFTNGVFTSAKLTILSFKPVSQPKGTFYWRVRSQDAAGNWSSWSLVRKVILK